MERESKYIEYKETITNSFLKTVSAYANYEGGKIVFGVDDNLKEVGIENPIKACIQIENKINDSIDPNPTYKLEIDKKTNTITLEVFSGLNKPYFYNSKAYKRNDSSTIEVDKTELKRLIMEGDNITFDSLRSSKQDLIFSGLEKSLKNELGISAFNIDILKTLQLYKDGEGYNNAANLLADNNSFSGIECVRFGKNENEIIYRDNYCNMSIIDQFEKCMNEYEKNYIIEIIEGKKRELKHLIPEVAFREAIANAIVHRTYDVNSTIKVKMFTDYVEIISPGSLPVGISKEDFKKGKLSVLRNPIVGEIFYRLKYIEKLGTGIKRINESYMDEKVKPEYIVGENFVLVKLPSINKMDDLNKTEKSISNLLINGKKLSREEIEKYLNLGKDKTIRVLNTLINKSVIVKTGKGKNIRYELAQ